jgi:hypothetical protein
VQLLNVCVLSLLRLSSFASRTGERSEKIIYNPPLQTNTRAAIYRRSYQGSEEFFTLSSESVFAFILFVYLFLWLDRWGVEGGVQIGELGRAFSCSAFFQALRQDMEATSQTHAKND